MTSRYARIFSTKKTPQSSPIPGRESDQALNRAGGYVFPVDEWTRLDRFLVLGSEGGTYYAGEREMTVDNAKAVLGCIKADGLRAVARIEEISVSGRAPKNEAAVFTLAIAAKLGNEATRKAALAAMPRVCRTGTHLFQFADGIQAFGGWGRGTRRAVAEWYSDKQLDSLAYQVVKYQQRDGWSHADLLRLSHPKPAEDSIGAVYKWIVDGATSVADERPQLPDIIDAFERAKVADTVAEIAVLVREHKLPREAVPTKFLKDPQVWAALLEDMPMTAMIRNLATMTRIGLLEQGSAAVEHVLAEVGAGARLRKARVHPMAILIAMKTYAAGRGVRSKQTWKPVPAIIDALDAAFYAAFSNVEPTGRKQLVAIDCSGSMMANVSGIPGLSVREASAAMALVTLAAEGHNAAVTGFTTRPLALSLSPRQRLDDAMKAIANVSRAEATDCSVPMREALGAKMTYDAISLYTDNESWFGGQHPIQALQEYRDRRKPDAKLVSVAMTATGHSVADQAADARVLNVAGFDANAPALIADFIREWMAKAENAHD
jgi:60 kDa SS-A/Ro ribonucleoprotein